jgi:hypothetical protein
MSTTIEEGVALAGKGRNARKGTVIFGTEL